ncbi:MAG: translation initiation factor IF-3 [Bacteroidota bacterium]
MARRPKRFTKRVQKPKFRINEYIRVPEIRLVGDNLNEISEEIGEKIESGIFQTRRALSIAEQVGLDLVEISPNASPPVCRIIDYKKFLYEKKKREKELKAKATKTVVKEIRFGPNTDDHDFNFKSKHAEKFLSDGAKVKAYVQFRGRTIVFKERGELLLLKFIQRLEDFGVPEALPKMEGRRMFVILAPKKVNKKK